MSASKDILAAVAMLSHEYGVLPVDKADAILSDVSLDDKGVVAAVMSITNEPAVLKVIGPILGLEFVDLTSTSSKYRSNIDQALRLDPRKLERASALPMVDLEGNPVIIMANPRTDSDTIEYLKTIYKPPLRVLLGMHSQIQSELVKQAPSFMDGDSARLAQEEDEERQARKAEREAHAPIQAGTGSPVVAWLDNLMARAAAENASDVHFMTQANGTLLVRFRVDGMLRTQAMPLRGREGEVLGSLLSRCPTIDPSDKTRPQDGAFSFMAAGERKIDTRLGMIPQVHGPLVVVRLLDPLNVRRRLDDMGFAPETLASMREASTAPQGLILVIGPTGSGKTTTLYALMNELDSLSKHIITAEDPVEYRLPNIGQTQIRNDLGEKSLTFAKALRSFLRLDPDIILVGEIRDADTAEVAMHAALTGHLVLSTIHANSALGVFQRLEELGGEPFLVAEALSLAVSQRLIARVHECREMVPSSPAQQAFLQRLGLPPLDMVAKPVGCYACNSTGYKGRIPVMEVLVPTPEVRSLVATGAPTAEVAAAARNKGWTSILADAYRHVSKGDSTVEEMLRVLDTGKGEA